MCSLGPTTTPWGGFAPPIYSANDIVESMYVDELMDIDEVMDVDPMDIDEVLVAPESQEFVEPAPGSTDPEEKGETEEVEEPEHNPSSTATDPEPHELVEPEPELTEHKENGDANEGYRASEKVDEEEKQGWWSRGLSQWRKETEDLKREAGSTDPEEKGEPEEVEEPAPRSTVPEEKGEPQEVEEPETNPSYFYTAADLEPQELVEPEPEEIDAEGNCDLYEGCWVEDEEEEEEERGL